MFPQKTTFIRNQLLQVQCLCLAIFFHSALLVPPAVAAPVFQCMTGDGTVIFTDSPAQLQACQELSLPPSEEALRGKAAVSPTTNQVRGGSRLAVNMAMMDEEFYESPSQDLEEEGYEEDM